MTHICLTGAGPCAGGRSYLLYDKFTTADDSPITSPRTCEPKGTLTAVQTDGTLAIAGGKLAFTKQTTPAWTDLGVYSAAITRAAGKCLLGSLNVSSVATSGLMVGFQKSQSLNFNGLSSNGIWVDYLKNFNWVDSGGNSAIVGAFEYSTDYQFAVILRATGSFLLIKGGSFTDWALLWVCRVETDATLYAAASFPNAAGTLDNFRIPATLWTPTPIASDSFNRADNTNLGVTDGAGAEEVGGSGLAWSEVTGDFVISSNKLAPTGTGSGSALWVASVDASAADIVAQATLTASQPAACGIAVRVFDASNFYLATIYDSSGDECRIYELAGTTWTSRAGTAMAATGTYNLLVACDGATITAYVNGASRASYGSATSHQTTTKHGVRFSTATETCDNFVVWNRTQTLPSF